MFQSESQFPCTSTSSPPTHLSMYIWLTTWFCSKGPSLKIGGIFLHCWDKSLLPILFSIFSTKHLNANNIGKNILGGGGRGHKPKIIVLLYFLCYFHTVVQAFNDSLCSGEKSRQKKLKNITTFLVLLRIIVINFFHPFSKHDYLLTYYSFSCWSKSNENQQHQQILKHAW